MFSKKPCRWQGQNVATATTPGYSRQRVQMEPVTSAAALRGWSPTRARGKGVGDCPIKSEFYDNQLMKARTMMSLLAAPAGDAGVG